MEPLNFPNKDFANKVESILGFYGIGLRPGLTVGRINKILCWQALTDDEIKENIVDIASELLLANINFISKNLSRTQELENIVDFIGLSIPTQNKGENDSDQRGKNFNDICVSTSVATGVEQILGRAADNLDISDEKLQEYIKVDGYFHGEKHNSSKPYFGEETISFIHGEMRVPNDSETVFDIGCIVVPSDYIERVCENPLESLADIVEIGSIYRDYKTGRLSSNSLQRAGLYRAEFLVNFMPPGVKYPLSDRSEHLLGEYMALTSLTTSVSEGLFYMADIGLVGSISQKVKADPKNFRLHLN